MPVVVFLFVRLVIEAIRAIGQRMRAVKPKSLCRDCSHAHVQYGVNGERAISCIYGGAIRVVKLDVLYCTDYRDRNAPPRTTRIGFELVREVEAELSERS
jgi:hypothetical protein